MVQSLTLPKGTVHIWYSPLDLWRNRVGELKGLLSAEEIQRSEELVFQNRSDDYIISRSILRKILAQYLGGAPESVSLELNTTGKPYLTSSRYYFNLSHSNDLFICGITWDTPIGIDLQHIYSISNIDTLIRNYFSPEEQQIVNSVIDSRIQDLFFTIWTAKEAYLKGTGEGFQRPVNSFTICQRDNNILTLKLKQETNTSLSETWNFRELHISSDYKAALAVKGNLVQIWSKAYLPGEKFLSPLEISPSSAINSQYWF